MPLSILAVLVIVGIGSIVAIVHFSGLSHEAVIRDGSHVKRLLSQDFPGLGYSTEPIITAQANAAFVTVKAPDLLGLVEVFGDRYITRILDTGDTKSVQMSGDDILVIEFADFTLRKRVYRFVSQSDMEKVNIWVEKLRVAI